MNTLELYVAAEAIYSNDTWWFLGFLPLILLAAVWIAAQVLYIAATFALPFLGPLIWFVFVRDKEDIYGRS